MYGFRHACARVLALAVGLGLISSAPAATPSSGTIARGGSVAWQGQHYAAAANTSGNVPWSDPECPSAALDPDNRFCDRFTLTVDVDPSFWQGHTGGATVKISWLSAEDDFDLYVFDSEGNRVAYSISGSSNTEKVFIADAAGTYEVEVVPWAVTDSAYEGAASFVEKIDGETPPGLCPAAPAAAYDSGGAPGAGFPNDPLYPRQWGLRQIDAPGAWAQGARGRGATIAVVDTGVDLQHPDLRKKISGGADLVEGGPDQPADCPAGPQDESGHGTHVAGIAAADTDNGIGVAGVAPLARIMPIRINRENGTGETEASFREASVRGIRMAAEQGADVINLSGVAWPSPSGPVVAFADVEAAVDYAWSLGAVVVGAAGNESFPLCDPPASFARALCVAATDSGGLPSWYSNFPIDLEGTVALRAPGGGGGGCEDDVDIWSTMWPGSRHECPGTVGYETLAGTSMAAPHVSGVAALLAARGLSNSEIVECLRTTSSNRGRFDPVMGYGIVNAAAAVREC